MVGVGVIVGVSVGGGPPAGTVCSVTENSDVQPRAQAVSVVEATVVVAVPTTVISAVFSRQIVKSPARSAAPSATLSEVTWLPSTTLL